LTDLIPSAAWILRIDLRTVIHELISQARRGVPGFSAAGEIRQIVRFPLSFIRGFEGNQNRDRRGEGRAGSRTPAYKRTKGPKTGAEEDSMSVILLIIFVCVSYLIVRIGAIALEMTGMQRSRARFQALSAFSGTGFTTKEAELVVNHPRRRKIVTYLMILGNAGIVSVIATFVVSLRQSGFRPSLNLVIIAASLYVLYRIASHQKFAQRLTTRIRDFLIEKLHFERVHVEELLQQADGFGVASVLVGKKSEIVGMTLAESGLRESDLMVLSIERDEEVIPVPKAQNKIRAGDRLICYGKLENLKERVST